MRVLLCTMPFVGHREPVRVFAAHCRRAIPELELQVYEVPPPATCTPASLGDWFDRFKSPSAIAPHLLECILREFRADAILADPAVFYALPVARELGIPIGLLGNLPILYLDERPLLQFTIPEFEPMYAAHPRVTFIGPMAALAHPLPFRGRGRVIHVTQGTLVADPDALLVPMRETGLLFTWDSYPSVVAPHAELFRMIDLLVTTGGYGGVSRALAAGVPMVVTGTTEDKPAVGERVMRAGNGLYRPTSDAIALRAACQEVLREPLYRDVAAMLREQCEAIAPTFAARVRSYLTTLVGAGIS